MAFPRLNAFSFWMTAFGGLLLYFSLVGANGLYGAGNAPDVGWFAYAPLTARTFSPGHSTDYWTLALLVSCVSSGSVDWQLWGFVALLWAFWGFFEDIAAWGTAVLVATHNVEIVRRFQRRVITLVHGRLVRDQPAGRTGRMAWLATS